MKICFSFNLNFQFNKPFSIILIKIHIFKMESAIRTISTISSISLIDFTHHLPFSCLIYIYIYIPPFCHTIDLIDYETVHVNQDTEVDKRQSPCTLTKQSDFDPMLGLQIHRFISRLHRLKIYEYLFAGQSFRTNSELIIYFSQ